MSEIELSVIETENFVEKKSEKRLESKSKGAFSRGLSSAKQFFVRFSSKTKTQDVSSHQESECKILVQEDEFDNYRQVEFFWSFYNLTRLSCWISFWLSFFYFVECVNITGHLLTSPDFKNESTIDIVDGKNPGCVILFGALYLMVISRVYLIVLSNLSIGQTISTFQATFYIGIVLVYNSRMEHLLQKKKLRLHFFNISIVLHFWLLSEFFLILLTLLYEYYINNELRLIDLVIAVRLVPMIAAIVRLVQVSEGIKTKAKSSMIVNRP